MNPLELAATDAHRLRERLMSRLAVSKAAEASMVTVRHRRNPRLALAPGASQQMLYEAPQPDRLRPGEALRARLIELSPGARVDAAELGDPVALSRRHREWLVLSGTCEVGGVSLAQRDYRVEPPGFATTALSSTAGALVFLRESDAAVATDEAPFTVFDAQAGWSDYAPGIRRRVLWQRGGMAALLYSGQPGASVPHHAHSHDEECLMLEGEFFLDDVLLRRHDFQIAPAGTAHRLSQADTAVVIYAHGDAELQFVG